MLKDWKNHLIWQPQARGRRWGRKRPISFIFANSPERFKAFEAAVQLTLYLQATHFSYTSDNSPTARKILQDREDFLLKGIFFRSLQKWMFESHSSACNGLLSPRCVSLTPPQSRDSEQTGITPSSLTDSVHVTWTEHFHLQIYSTLRHRPHSPAETSCGSHRAEATQLLYWLWQKETES